MLEEAMKVFVPLILFMLFPLLLPAAGIGIGALLESFRPTAPETDLSKRLSLD